MTKSLRLSYKKTYRDRQIGIETEKDRPTDGKTD